MLRRKMLWFKDWLRCAHINANPRRRYFAIYPVTLVTLTKVHHFIAGEAPTQELLHRCYRLLADGAKDSIESLDTVAYPHGWTGYVDVWQRYCSDGVMQDYQAAANEFLEHHADTASLQTLYPDLINLNRS